MGCLVVPETQDGRTQDRQTQGGFSLIEIIVSLILIGILGVFFGFGLTTAMKSYVFTKKNAETTQKGQVALARITKELSVINGVTSGTDTSISFTSYKEGVQVTQTLSWSGTADDPLYLGADILVDNVDRFDLGYYDLFSGPKGSSWTGSTKIIEIGLGITGAESAVSTFTTRMMPRNL